MAGSVLIVGASVAGIGAANELRRCGFSGSIAVVDAQPHLPYDRPPLSKAMLKGEMEVSALQFHDRDYYARARIDLHLGSAARGLDVVGGAVLLDSGERLAADRIIIATGARARPFPADRCTGRVHLLRDLDDASGLHAQLRQGRRLVVIGGGFIGAEVASTASGLGLGVVVVDAAAQPFERILGSEIAARLAALHVQAGVELLCGVAVSHIGNSVDGKATVVLADGRRLEADIVVAGLGSLPNVEWLAASGLDLSDGVVCNEKGQTAIPGIFAAGDVAVWRDPFTGSSQRHEHWTAAREQARIVAQVVAGDEASSWRHFVPYFWSDLYGVRLQMLGSVGGGADMQIIHDEPARRAFVAEYHRAGELVAVVGCNAGARTMRYASRLVPHPVSADCI